MARDDHGRAARESEVNHREYGEHRGNRDNSFRSPRQKAVVAAAGSGNALQPSTRLCWHFCSERGSPRRSRPCPQAGPRCRLHGYETETVCFSRAATARAASARMSNTSNAVPTQTSSGYAWSQFCICCTACSIDSASRFFTSRRIWRTNVLLAPWLMCVIYPYFREAFAPIAAIVCEIRTSIIL